MLAYQLEKVNPDAAASRGTRRDAHGHPARRDRLAPEDTRAHLTAGPRRRTATQLLTVMSTNPVESMIEIVRAHARNVKRCQPGDMRLRSAAAGMLAASNQFRRAKDYLQLPKLADVSPSRRRCHRAVHHRCDNLTI